MKVRFFSASEVGRQYLFICTYLLKRKMYAYLFSVYVSIWTKNKANKERKHIFPLLTTQNDY